MSNFAVMTGTEIRQRIKPWILPFSMVGGVLFHEAIASVEFITPYLIFVMLLITFCKVKPNEFRITRLSWLLLSVQVVGALIAYFILLPFNSIVAQAIFMCIFCPTATAAPVVTGMLRGSIPRVTTYSIMSNITVAILSPIIFSMIGEPASHNIHTTTSFDIQLMILSRIGPLLLIPLLLAILLMKYAPKTHQIIARHQPLSFYIWAVALFIVMGRAINFVINEPTNEIPTMVAIALGSGIVCCLQFWIGRKIGYLCGDKIAGAQGLGQKNTILAIWMALTWLHPLASVGPAAYIVWQNIINSAQIYNATKRQ